MSIINMEYLRSRKYRCGCGSVHSTRQEFLCHQVIQHAYDFQVFQCNVCDYTSHLEEKIKIHVELGHGACEEPTSSLIASASYAKKNFVDTMCKEPVLSSADRFQKAFSLCPGNNDGGPFSALDDEIFWLQDNPHDAFYQSDEGDAPPLDREPRFAPGDRHPYALTRRRCDEPVAYRELHHGFHCEQEVPLDLSRAAAFGQARRVVLSACRATPPVLSETVDAVESEKDVATPHDTLENAVQVEATTSTGTSALNSTHAFQETAGFCSAPQNRDGQSHESPVGGGGSAVNDVCRRMQLANISEESGSRRNENRSWESPEETGADRVADSGRPHRGNLKTFSPELFDYRRSPADSQIGGLSNHPVSSSIVPVGANTGLGLTQEGTPASAGSPVDASTKHCAPPLSQLATKENPVEEPDVYIIEVCDRPKWKVQAGDANGRHGPVDKFSANADRQPRTPEINVSGQLRSSGRGSTKFPGLGLLQGILVPRLSLHSCDKRLAVKFSTAAPPSTSAPPDTSRRRSEKRRRRLPHRSTAAGACLAKEVGIALRPKRRSRALRSQYTCVCPWCNWYADRLNLLKRHAAAHHAKEYFNISSVDFAVLVRALSSTAIEAQKATRPAFRSVRRAVVGGPTAQRETSVANECGAAARQSGRIAAAAAAAAAAANVGDASKGRGGRRSSVYWGSRANDKRRLRHSSDDSSDDDSSDARGGSSALHEEGEAQPAHFKLSATGKPRDSGRSGPDAGPAHRPHPADHAPPEDRIRCEKVTLPNPGRTPYSQWTGLFNQLMIKIPRSEDKRCGLSDGNGAKTKLIAAPSKMPPAQSHHSRVGSLTGESAQTSQRCGGQASVSLEDGPSEPRSQSCSANDVQPADRRRGEPESVAADRRRGEPEPVPAADRRRGEPEPVPAADRRRGEPEPVPPADRRRGEPEPVAADRRRAEPEPVPAADRRRGEPEPVPPADRRRGEPEPVAADRRRGEPEPVSAADRRRGEPEPVPADRRRAEPGPVPADRRRAEPGPVPAADRRRREPEPVAPTAADKICKDELVAVILRDLTSTRQNGCKRTKKQFGIPNFKKKK